jgi:cell division protein FtsI (penicillin-binding protein 3)
METMHAKPRRRDQTRARLWIVIGAFLAVYGVITGRLVLFGMAEEDGAAYRAGAAEAIAAARPDLTDRNGEILATDIKTASLYAEPRKILDPDEAAEEISAILPELDTASLRQRLAGNAGFVWLKREITPSQQEAIHHLGLPGIGFLTENRRFYPGGPTASHIVGLVNVDNQGIAGMEKYVDDHWLAALHDTGFANTDDLAPVRLSIDLRVQHVLRNELENALTRYQAIAAAGIVLDIHTGEVLAMSSLPDFDPNDPAEALQPDRLNRMTAGVFELGSVFKTFTLAMGLDAGTATLRSTYDATQPIRAGGFAIHDFHGKHRVLTLPEVFIYSSNIGASRIALEAGIPRQQEFLHRIGMEDRIRTELPETALPLLPSKWGELSAMTISFGHGISVTPLHVAVAAAALMNGGRMIPPTFLPRDRATADQLAVRVVSPQTSADMRYLFRLNVEHGSGRQAEVPGYVVGGKTGTAEKIVGGRYAGNKRLNSFLAAFPMDDPQYLVLVVIDEPQPEKPGMGATAGSNAAPTVAAVIRRAAPMLGVQPRAPGAGDALFVSY